MKFKASFEVSLTPIFHKIKMHFFNIQNYPSNLHEEINSKLFNVTLKPWIKLENNFLNFNAAERNLNIQDVFLNFVLYSLTHCFYLCG